MAPSSSRDRSASPGPRRTHDYDESSRRDRDRTRAEEKERRHRSKDDDAEGHSSRSKPHRSHKERRNEGEAGEDDGSDDEVDPRVLELGATAIDEDDFYNKAAEFKNWLRTSKRKYLDELSSRQARGYFDKFVRRWNRGDLDDAYYLGQVRTAGSSAASQTRHKWSFSQTKLTREEQDMLETTRDNVDTLTNANSRGAIEARAAERRLGKGKRMTERDGEAGGDSASRDLGEGTSANSGVRDSGWGARPPARASESQFDREARIDRERRSRQAETRKDRRDMKEDLDELAPKATGRDAVYERKQEIRATNREFANRKDGDDGFDMDDGVIMGGGPKGGDDFRSALAQRDRANARQQQRAEGRRAERQAESSERFSAMKQKESDTMAMFKAMAQQRFGAG